MWFLVVFGRFGFYHRKYFGSKPQKIRNTSEYPGRTQCITLDGV